MPHHLVIDSSKYAIYVKVLAGQGDGTLIWVDAQGHIHVGPDPRPIVNVQLQAAVKQIETGIAAFADAVSQKGL